ncbi:GlcG/HbpS family heme-binding protein [Hydrogenophaga pseudoflava]|uniref:GlcG/HbpS family heme-binding protein n=1 Tax=Hydrogenophaga pseudoflava TaxID=47421 RepID=UPI0027E59D58|nr:heme-binding protein [Hydrogenophaga pseudoflava]MDQ7745933.1 heme-binding protein [Hydrogenophaga pseudoflava]
MSLSVDTSQIGTTAAHAAVAASVGHARTLGIAINVAVVDGSGTLMAFLRMNGAFLHSIDIAIDKAYTAASFGFPTSKWGGVIGDDELLRIGLNQRQRLVLFGGGLPLVENGRGIGGIGVSGGSAEQDEACAAAGLTALGLAHP